MSMDVDDAGLYPNDWDEFVGQEEVKLQLLSAIRAAQARGKPLEHVLLASGPGIGKSALALLVIKELGVNYRVQAGPIGPADLMMLFAGMRDGDVLLLEEAHKLADGGKAKSEWLLHYLQDGVLVTPSGIERVARCTVIATTTDAGRLPAPVLQRFQIVPAMQPYTDVEGARIAVRLANRLLVDEGLPAPSSDCAAAVALAANNQPRIMRRILVNLRNLALSGIIPTTPDYDLKIPLRWSGLTHDGLDHNAQTYLLELFDKFGGRPAGKAVIISLTNVMGTALADVERHLMAKGLIRLHGTTGRGLTMAGIERALALKLQAAS